MPNGVKLNVLRQGRDLNPKGREAMRLQDLFPGARDTGFRHPGMNDIGIWLCEGIYSFL